MIPQIAALLYNMARFTLLACLIAAADAFAPLARPALRAATSVAMAPVDVAQSLDVVSRLPTQLVSLATILLRQEESKS